jgi:uncharacterized protein (DUF302 family)
MRTDQQTGQQTGHKDYAISAGTDLPFAEAVSRTRELLQDAGYGVLCEIDVKAKLEEKLGVERQPYVILGACNPPLASEGLNTEPNLGVLLPCNVVIYEHDDRTLVAAVEPERMLSIVGNEELGPIARRVREDLVRVVEEIAKS